MSTTSISEPSGFLMCSMCVCLWVGVSWLLWVFFLSDQALDDSFDQVGEQVGCYACAYGEKYGYEHWVEELGAFGLGEVGFGEGAGYVVFVPGGGEFFEGDVEVG